MASKSEYVVLRMLPGDPGLAVAKSGMENLKDAKAIASDLAMKNSEVVFIPAVLYEVAYAKKIVSYQITEPPEDVMRLLGFVNSERKSTPTGTDTEETGTEEGGTDTEETGGEIEEVKTDNAPASKDAAPSTPAAEEASNTSVEPADVNPPSGALF